MCRENHSRLQFFLFRTTIWNRMFQKEFFPQIISLFDTLSKNCKKNIIHDFFLIITTICGEMTILLIKDEEPSKKMDTCLWQSGIQFFSHKKHINSSWKVYQKWFFSIYIHECFMTWKIPWIQLFNCLNSPYCKKESSR